jgi:3-mercaptopyruvate sulfurtransferase SseA
MQYKRRHNSTANSAADNQIWLIHQAIVEKLLAEPWRIADVRQTLEQRYQAGQIRHSGYIHWHSILDCIDDPALFRRELLDSGERMTKLRRRTVLVGILTEAERSAALQAATAS